MVGRSGETYLKETTVRYQFSSLPKFSNILQCASSKVKCKHHGTEMLRSSNSHAQFRALVLIAPRTFSNSLEKWYFLKAHISLTWQNSISRSFPTVLVQSCAQGIAPAGCQVQAPVIIGASALWRGSLL